MRADALPILTPFGFSLLGVATLGPLVGALSDVPFTKSLSISLLILFLFLLLFLIEYRRIKPLLLGFSVRAEAPPAAFSGRELSLELDLAHPRGNKHYPMSVRAALPAHVEPKLEVLSFKLFPRAQTSITICFTSYLRGDITLSKLWFRVHGPICSWQFTRTLDPPVAIPSFPDPHRGEEPHILTQTLHPSGAALVQLAGGEGREFDHLRAYIHGDDLRRVDWKRSAKRNSLVVRAYRPETHQRICLVLDCSRRLATRVGPKLQLDYSADAAAHLAQLATSTSDEVGLLAFHHRIITEIPTRRGQRQQSLIMEALRQLEVSSLDPDYTLVRRWGLAQPRRSLIVFITSLSMPESFESIRDALVPLTRKHLAIVLAIRDEQMHEIEQRAVGNLREAYIQAAAAQQLEAIDARVEMLRRCGIYCSYSHVLDLPRVAARQYLEVKLSGRL